MESAVRPANQVAKAPEQRATWLNRPFVMIWVAMFVSVLGDGFTQVALSMWALQTSGSAMPMTVLLTSRAITSAVFGPIAGGLVDRMDRRTAMMLANGARAVTTLGLAFLVTMPATDVLIPAVILTVLGGLFGSLHEPARSASLVMVVGKDNLARASSMMQLTGMIAMVFGPVLGGVFVAMGGAYLAMVGDGFSFLVAFLAILLAGKIANPPQKEGGRPPFWSSMAEGLRFLGTNRLIGTFVLLVAPLITFCQSAVAVLFPVMAVMVWKVTGVTFGLLQGMFALGFVLALVGLSIRGDKIRRRGLAWGLGMISGGVLLGVMGSLTSPMPVFPVLAGVGFTLALSNVVTQVAVQRETPPEVQGRVFGVQTSMLSVTTPLALSLVGLLTDQVGPAAITTASGILIALVGIGGLMLPHIRRYELPPAPAK